MARKKVNLQWISNRSTRSATYKRRCNGLVKKASELTTLCSSKACVVVYNEGDTQPEVWPSDGEAKNLLMKFKEMPEVGTFKKTQNQEIFLDNRSRKLREQVRKLEQGNCEDETFILLHDNMDGSHPGLTGIAKDELVSLRKIVEMKVCKSKALLQQLVEQA